MNFKPIPVEQYTKNGEFIASYPSISAAARATGLQTVSIRTSLHNLNYSGGGYIWAHNAEDARIKIKINDLLKTVDNQGEATFTLNNNNELEVLQARVNRRKTIKMKNRLLDDGRIWVHLFKGRKKMKRLPVEERSNKPKWWLCYQVNGLDYRYALDFGRGDTPKEAIMNFKRSRMLSNLNHKVIYINRDGVTYRDSVGKGTKANGLRKIYRLTVPTTGDFLKGEEIINSNIDSDIEKWVCVTAGNQQGDKGKCRRLAFQHRRQQMPFHVMHPYHRHPQGIAQGCGNGATHHQGTHQARPGGVGDTVNIGAGQAGLGQHRLNQRQGLADMIP